MHFIFEQRCQEDLSFQLNGQNECSRAGSTLKESGVWRIGDDWWHLFNVIAHRFLRLPIEIQPWIICIILCTCFCCACILVCSSKRTASSRFYTLGLIGIASSSYSLAYLQHAKCCCLQFNSRQACCSHRHGVFSRAIQRSKDWPVQSRWSFSSPGRLYAEWRMSKMPLPSCWTIRFNHLLRHHPVFLK